MPGPEVTETSVGERTPGRAGVARPRPRRRGFVASLAVVLVAGIGTVSAQTREGGDIGASSQSVKQGALQPLRTGQGAPPPRTPVAPGVMPLRGGATSPGMMPLRGGTTSGGGPRSGTTSPGGVPTGTTTSPGGAPGPGTTSPSDAANPGTTPSPSGGTDPGTATSAGGVPTSTTTSPGGAPPPSPAAASGTSSSRGTPAAPNVVPAPGSPSTVLPPPSSYLSSAWNVWPHAWAFVPTVWSAWYRDYVLQSRPATPAERIGTETSRPSRPDQPEATPTAPVVTAPPTKLIEPDSTVLPAPRVVRRRRFNLVISGVGILAATWAADRLLANGLSTRPETWVPLVGPWFLLGQQSALASPSVSIQVPLVIDGLLQAGGLSMTILGLVLTTKQYVVTVKPMRSDAVPREAL